MLARALLVLLLAAPVSLAQDAAPETPGQPAETAPTPARPARLVYVAMDTSAGELILELNAEKAPITVENFLQYVDRKAYDGTIFHRIVPDFVIQGGGYDKDLNERAKADAAAGKPDKPIRNEWTNGLKNEAGTIAMARDAEPDTATREFYFNLKHNTQLDTAREKTGKAGYAVFGRIVKGMDVIDRMKTVETRKVSDDMQHVPVEPITIRTVKRMSREDADQKIGAPGGSGRAPER